MSIITLVIEASAWGYENYPGPWGFLGGWVEYADMIPVAGELVQDILRHIHHWPGIWG